MPGKHLKVLVVFNLSFAFSSLGTGALGADLGSNCCSDLEDRISELENTTARKGNRKLSLTVTGWVNEAVFFWDDGKETNAYVGTNDLEQSRVQFKGDAKITPDVSAGYRLELGAWGANARLFSQNNTGNSNEVIVRQSNWYLSSKTYGKFTLGHTGPATYHLIDDLDTTRTRNVSDYEAAGAYIGSFFVRSDGNFIPGVKGDVRWTQIMNGYNKFSLGQSGRRNVIRYDSPEIMGFIGTVAWGEDDLFDGALRYKNKFGDFSLVAAAGYGRSTQRSDYQKLDRSCGPSDAIHDVGYDPGPPSSGSPGRGDFCQWWSAGGLIKHEPTGLFAYGGYGAQQVDLKPGSIGSDISSTAYIQWGIEKGWFSIGNTTIFGEYRHDDVGQSTRGSSSNLDFWAGGLAQHIENADLTLYAMYRHNSGEFTNAVGTKVYELDPLDMVITGGKLNF